MVKYYKTPTTKRYLKIDDENLSAIFLFIDKDKKVKSDITKADTYTKIVEESQNSELWNILDEVTFNEALAQIP